MMLAFVCDRSCRYLWSSSQFFSFFLPFLRIFYNSSKNTEKKPQRHPLCPQCGLSRASQLARRDALSLTVSAPRLSDFLSNSRSGDAADWQVACGSMLWQRRFVSSLELRRARPADGDTSVFCGPRASAMRPRRVAVGYRPRERSVNDDRDGCSTVYHHSGCDCCESGSARPLKCLYAVVWIGVFNNTLNSTYPQARATPVPVTARSSHRGPSAQKLLQSTAFSTR